MRVRALLDAALEQRTTLRTHFLRATASDADVLREALALLPHYAAVSQRSPDPVATHPVILPGTTTLRQALGLESAEHLPDWEPPFAIPPYYSVVEVVGAGGMGVVYRAVDSRLGREFAVKLLRSRLRSSEDRRRFKHEEELLRQLHHPGIVRLLHGGVATRVCPAAAGDVIDERPFFVMEFVRGRSLLDYATAQRLSSLQRLSLFVAICAPVEYAHHRGVVHRDLKPENILVDQSGQPKVLDFGIARLMSLVPAGLGPPGRFTGTVAYASPEQWSGRDDALTPASDVYTLGLILHELLTGQLPLRTRGRVQLDLRSVALPDGGPDTAAHTPAFRYAVRAVIAAALRKTSGRGYADAGEMATDLSAIVSTYAVGRTWREWLSRLGQVGPSGPVRPEGRDAGHDRATHERLLAAILRRRVGQAMDDDVLHDPQ